MKKKIILIIVCTVLSIVNFRAQNPLWSLPNQKIEFNPVFGVSYLPDPGNPSSAIYQFGSWPEFYDGRQAEIANNSATDADGNILFFIVDNHLFDLNGKLVDVLRLDFVTDPNSPDYEIIPVPGDCNKYYIIVTEISQAGDNSIEYFIYDRSASPCPNDPNCYLGDLVPVDADGNLHKSLKESSLWQKGNQGVDNIFFATTPLRNDNKRFLFISSYDYIYFYEVTSSGIFIDEDKCFTFIPDDLTPNNQPFYLPYFSGQRGELEVVESTFGYRLLFSSSMQSYYPNFQFDYELFKSIFVYDLDNDANRIFQNVGGVMVDRKGRFDFKDRLTDSNKFHIIYGLEFANNSPNNFLLNKEGTDFFTEDDRNLFYFSLNINILTNEIEFTEDFRRNFLNFNKSQIEAGVNGSLYMVNNAELLQLSGTYPSIIMTSTISGLNYSSVNTGGEFFTLPNQIDNENYSNNFTSTCCFAPEIHYKTFDVSPQTATWDGITLNNPFNSDEIVIRESLYFPSGANVTIKDMTIRFDAGAKMIIDNGAKVTLDNTTLTNRCNELWEGIEVYGNASVSHSSLLQHGQLIMNNSEINNAKKGAMMYARTPNGNVDFSKSGGIIKATESTFRNNIKDVEFFPFSFSNFSAFTFCNFLSDDNMLDGINSEAHLSLFGVRNIRIKGCNFTNSQTNVPFNLLGSGITSFDANFSVDFGCNSSLKPCPIADQQKTTFNNLYEGVYAQASNPVISFSVKNTEFNDCYKGIYMGGVDYAIVRNNFFKLVEEQDVNNFPYGIYSQSCTGYSIDNNEIEDPNNVTTFGLIINNSNNQGNSNDVNFVYKNEFNSVKYSSVAMNANVGYKETDFGQINTFPRSGLKYKCNSFTNSQDVDIFIQENGGISPIQGRCFNPTTGANNRFNSPNASIGNFWNNNTLYFDIDYRYNTTPTNQYQVGVYNFFTTDVYDCLTTFDSQLDVCPTNMYKSATEQGLLNEITLIENEIGTKEQNLINFDNNYETVWNARQNGNMSWGVFKNNVMAMEPIIKEERLIDFVNSNPPGGIAKQILTYNSPLTDSTLQAVTESNLSNGIKNNIISAQNASVPNERLSREQDVDYLYAEKTTYNNELIRFYIHDDESKMDLDKLDEFLRQNDDVYCKCQSVNVKIADRKYSEAQVLIDSLRTIDNGKFDDFCSFREQLIDFANQVDNCFIIKQDTIRKQRVELLANKGYGERTCFAANLLLNRIFKYDFQEEKPQFNVSKSLISSNNEISLFEEETTVEMYPNPTNGNVTFELDFESYENIAIEVYNLQGQLVIATSINSQESYIDLSNLNDGLYFIKTKLSENETKVTKMILRK